MGKVTLTDTIDRGTIESIEFKNTYVNPVVVAYLMERGGKDSVEVRVSGITSTGCYIFMEENDGEQHENEDVGYIVMEAGVWKLPDGTKIEAGTTSTDSNHEDGEDFGGVKVNFFQLFDTTPVVLHTLNSYNNEYLQ